MFVRLIFRGRGGREAEREERQLWETPERKRSTKPTGKTMTSQVCCWLIIRCSRFDDNASSLSWRSR